MINVEDPSALVSYLRAHGVIENGDAPEISVLRGGISSATVLVRLPGSEDLVVKQALPKLRVPVDQHVITNSREQRFVLRLPGASEHHADCSQQSGAKK